MATLWYQIQIMWVQKSNVKTKYPKMKKYLKNNDFIRVSINLSYTYKNDKIKKNDEIALFPPVSGG